MKVNKKGTISSPVEKTLIGFILIVVLFKLYAALMPEAQSAGDELNASGVPLGSFFTSDGIIFLIIMVALLIKVIRDQMKK